MENYLFDINNKNALALQREFNLRNNQAMEINYRFRPIISLKELSVNDFENLLEEEKNDFIKKRGKFMIDIFKRNYLESLIYDLEEYLDNIKKGKNKIYDFVNGTYFHWFKLELDKKYYTLLLSNKDETDIEIYFIDLLNCIKSFISKNETLMPQKKEDNFQDDLLNFSNIVCSIPLDKLTIQRLIYLDSDELQEEFKDSNSFLIQDLLIKTNENYINLILQNLSTAIETNCGNNIDLENVSIPENFGYSFKPNRNEKSISKIYKDFEIRPPQQDQFKIIWLKTFLQDLKKIDFTIRKILQLPQKDYSKLKPINIYNLIEEYEAFTNEFQQKIEKEFQKPVPKSEKLNFYFDEMLPDYIEKIDSYFLQFEEMRTSFKNQFGYLDNKINSLNEIISKAQINEISNIEKFLNNIEYNNFQNLKNRFQSVIAKIRSNKKLQQKETSSFLDELTNRVENILREQPQPVQETKPKKESDANHTEAIEKLKTVWLAEPKLTVEDFIQKGIDKGLWNESLKIITSKGSLYGTGKTLLSSIYFAFKGWAISVNTNYNEVGKVFCEVFNIKIKETTKEPYKAFSSGNPKIITEIKRTFGIKNS